MTVNTQQLKVLQEQIARKKHLKALQTELGDQQRTLIDKTAGLKAAYLQEQQDVDRLEGKTLAAMFYEIIGKKEDKLTKEKREAYAARLKYDAAVRELEAVESRLRSVGGELETLRDCESLYERELQRALEEIKRTGDPRGERVLALEARIADRERDIKELKEAVSAGTAAMAAVDAVLHHLEDAEGWGTWDLFGGGLLADIAKHDALDSAQKAVEVLQVRLRSFKTELVDVEMEVNVQISIDGFLGFADWFFDGFFADFAVMDRIEQASARMHDAKQQLQRAMSTLQNKTAEAEGEIAVAREELGQLAAE